jgi:hypothetical protein
MLQMVGIKCKSSPSDRKDQSTTRFRDFKNKASLLMAEQFSLSSDYKKKLLKSMGCFIFIQEDMQEEGLACCNAP